MRNLINPDAPIMVFISRVAYSAMLGCIWLICCIPIFTAGAATTALFTVTLKMVRNQEGNVFAQFFQAFKSNFKQSTIAGLIMLGLGLVLAVDGYALYHLRFENAFWTVLTAIFIVVLIAYAIIAMYLFPLMAYFDNTIPAMFRNSIMIGMRYIICTAVMAAIYFAMACVVINLLTPILIFAEGLCAYFCSYLLINILEACEGTSDQAEQTEQAEETEE